VHDLKGLYKVHKPLLADLTVDSEASSGEDLSWSEGENVYWSSDTADESTGASSVGSSEETGSVSSGSDQFGLECSDDDNDSEQDSRQTPEDQVFKEGWWEFSDDESLGSRAPSPEAVVGPDKKEDEKWGQPSREGSTPGSKGKGKDYTLPEPPHYPLYGGQWYKDQGRKAGGRHGPHAVLPAVGSSEDLFRMWQPYMDEVLEKEDAWTRSWYDNLEEYNIDNDSSGDESLMLFRGRRVFRSSAPSPQMEEKPSGESSSASSPRNLVPRPSGPTSGRGSQSDGSE